MTGAGSVGDGVMRGCFGPTPIGLGLKTASADPRETKARRIAKGAGNILVSAVSNELSIFYPAKWIGKRGIWIEM